MVIESLGNFFTLRSDESNPECSSVQINFSKRIIDFDLRGEISTLPWSSPFLNYDSSLSIEVSLLETLAALSIVTIAFLLVSLKLKVRK